MLLKWEFNWMLLFVKWKYLRKIVDVWVYCVFKNFDMNVECGKYSYY